MTVGEGWFKYGTSDNEAATALFKAGWYLYIPHDVTLSMSLFAPHRAVCSVRSVDSDCTSFNPPPQKKKTCKIDNKHSLVVHDVPTTCFGLYTAIIREPVYEAIQIRKIFVADILCFDSTHAYLRQNLMYLYCCVYSLIDDGRVEAETCSRNNINDK